MNETESPVAQEVREAPLKKYRITVERILEVEAINPQDAVNRARRKFNVDVHSTITQVEELIPQPPIVKSALSSEWEDKR